MVITVAIVAALCVVGVAVYLLSNGPGRRETLPIIPSGTASPTSSTGGPSPAPSGTSSGPPVTGSPGATSSTASPSGSTTVASPSPSCVAVPTVHRLRAVTFNIHSALRGRTVMINQIADEIDRLDADIVLLQEVDAHRGYSGWVDMPAVLSSALGMNYAYGVNVVGQTTSHGQSQYGTLVLGRFPILSKSNTMLVNERGLQQRGLLKTVFDIDGTPLSVYDTHLENNTGSGNHADLRTRQAQQAAAIIASDPNPAIVGGDMNSGPGSPAINAFTRVARDPWPAVGIGSPASHGHPPDVRIDWLLHRGADLEPVAARVGTTAISDHQPVITDYRLRGTKLVGECARRP